MIPRTSGDPFRTSPHWRDFSNVDKLDDRPPGDRPGSGDDDRPHHLGSPDHHLVITECLLVICVKKCRKKEEENEDDFAGDLNEDYGVYYSAEG